MFLYMLAMAGKNFASICFVKKCDIFEKKKMQIISFAANPTFNLCKSKMLDKTMDLFMKRLLNPVSH